MNVFYFIVYIIIILEIGSFVQTTKRNKLGSICTLILYTLIDSLHVIVARRMSNVSIRHWFYQHFECRLLAASWCIHHSFFSLLRTDTGKTCFYHHVNRVMQLFYGDSIDGIRVRLPPLYCLCWYCVAHRCFNTKRSTIQFGCCILLLGLQWKMFFLNILIYPTVCQVIWIGNGFLIVAIPMVSFPLSICHELIKHGNVVRTKNSWYVLCFVYDGLEVEEMSNEHGARRAKVKGKKSKCASIIEASTLHNFLCWWNYRFIVPDDSNLKYFH